MREETVIKKIATIENGFSGKFGIPRQSRLCESVPSRIIFEPEYRIEEAVKGLEDFSHIWIIWQFSENADAQWTPTVRPPRLGGNRRMGVFATRSPFRPNSLGLSCVKLDKITYDNTLGPVLHVSGADLMNGTPIYDIKPYIPYADSIEDACSGFVGQAEKRQLTIAQSDWHQGVDKQIFEAVCEIISQDPRPAYQDDPERVYKFEYAGYNISFKAENGVAFITDFKEIK